VPPNSHLLTPLLSAYSQLNEFDPSSMYNGSEFSRRYSDYIQDDQEIKLTVCDMENQRVVRADAERTRGQEQLDKDIIELILTKYCKNNNIKYKQGLNEIVAPFMYLMQETQKMSKSNEEKKGAL
jgi:hypothetical protein